MTETQSPKSWHHLDTALKRSFTDGACWPIDRAGLAALIDMGLSETQIAAYFSVAPGDVQMLCDRYHLARKAGK